MPHRRYPERIHCLSRTIPPPGNVRALRHVISNIHRGILLESAAPHAAWGRHSIYAINPARVLSWSFDTAHDPLLQMADCCRPWGVFDIAPASPFVGGWVGYLAYETGRFIEPSTHPVTSDNDPHDRDGDLRLPPISSWALFDTVLIHDGFEDTWTVAGVDLPPRLTGGPRPALPARLAALEELVRAAGERETPDDPRDSLSRESVAAEWNYSREAYLRKVERTLEYIRAGDIFQANLARRCRVATAASPFAIYQRLCATNPSTYAAYYPISDGPRRRSAIVSSSPELFLQVRGGHVTTRPIKGTRPRGATAQTDAAASRELAVSEKDRAELNMIIDLERNDLGRVCEFGTVRVVHDGEIETLPTVFHRTATIVGRLRAEADAIDLLRATFPGGSITGAPKVRAMQIIDELERSPRGPYCGAIGWIGLNGDMTLNLAIRTIVVGGDHADVMVGSGIVADSDPEAEYEELGAKAAGMLAALNVPAEEPLALVRV